MFVTSLAGQLLVLPLFGIPEPNVHDEFGYLLAADTFAHGRLANTHHPLWAHFETFHVLQQPTYMAMQPPGQGLLLATALVAHLPPILAVWISVAAACAAVCWAARAFAPPSWALLGGLLFAIRLGVVTYWSFSYWGGALAALGGALVLGGAGRVARGRPGLAGAAIGAGASILLLTRPFEGLFAALPAAVLVAARCIAPGARTSRAGVVRGVVLPTGLLLGGALAFVGLSNAAVTGSPFRSPYSLQRDTYAVSRHFVGQAERPAPSYRHEVMRDFYTRWERENFSAFSPGHGPLADLAAAGRKLLPVPTFFVGAALLPPFLLLPATLGRKRSRLVAFTLLSSLAGFLLVSWWIVPHYAAPAAAALWIAMLEGVRRLAVLAHRFGRRASGPTVAVFAAVGVALGLRLAAPSLGLRVGGWPPAWYSTVRYAGYSRNALQDDLTRRGGRHLVFVRYRPGHSPHLEWVFNGADLSSTPVLWARSMGAEADARLVRYEAGRKAWLLEPDRDPWALRPYQP